LLLLAVAGVSDLVLVIAADFLLGTTSTRAGALVGEWK
jgi:hypothetical protein